MYKITLDSAKKIADAYNLLNQLEIRGISNVSLLYSSMVSLQQILQELEKQNKDDIVIDNTKGG